MKPVHHFYVNIFLLTILHWFHGVQTANPYTTPIQIKNLK